MAANSETPDSPDCTPYTIPPGFQLIFPIVHQPDFTPVATDPPFTNVPSFPYQTVGSEERITVLRHIGKLSFTAFTEANSVPNAVMWAVCKLDEDEAEGTIPVTSLFTENFWRQERVIMSGWERILSECALGAGCLFAPNPVIAAQWDSTVKTRLETGEGLYFIMENCAQNADDIFCFGLTRALFTD